MILNPVALVILPAPYLISDRVFPPLGVLYLASYLESRGIGVHVIDLAGDNSWRETLARKLRALKPQAVGISATTPDYPLALKALGVCRRTLPGVTVMLGGAHATIAPWNCMQFDKVVVGDGWNGIIKALSGRGPRVIRSKIVSDLDSVPFPARHLVSREKYKYILDGRRAASVITRLGCPFNCIFCCGRSEPFYRKVRSRSPENVLAELDVLRETYGYRAFVFYDDEFNIDRDRVMRLSELMGNRDYIWRAPMRADCFDHEMARAMRKAGCVEICVGVESGSRKILEIARKGCTPEMNTRTRRICRDNGIRFKAFVVVGLPGSTRRDEEMTIRWLIENRPDNFDIAVNTPYPGTPQYDMAEKFGLTLDMDFSRDVASYKVAPGKYTCLSRTKSLDFDEILHLRDFMDSHVRSELGIPSPSGDSVRV